MSADPRQELAAIAASLRAYLEQQLDTGATGIPRRARAATAAADVAAAASSDGHAVAAASDGHAVAAPQAAAPQAATPDEHLKPHAAAAPHAPAVHLGLGSAAADPSMPKAAPPGRAAAIEAALETPEPTRTAPRAPAPARPAAAPARALGVIQAEVSSCLKCGLHEQRKNTVFSRGNPQAKLCFVGEAPGADEDEQGVPFVGRAGQLLDKMIVAMGLDPADDVYVCNIVKCRPPDNRRPEPEEIDACIPYLHEQLAAMKPKVIVALGNTAVGALLGTKLGITKVRGAWKLYRGSIPVMPTYHPSYLLRPSAQQGEAKRQAWEDLQAVMKELGLKPPPKKA